MSCLWTRFALALIGLALVLELTACVPRVPEGLRAPPGAVAAVAAQRPTLARIQGNLWIVGLPQRHGWARERRVVLTKHDPERNVDVKVGVVVVLDDTYATAAPVGIVYEEPGASFDGALAEIVPTDQHLRVGRGFGTLAAALTTTLVEITLGRNDGVGVGDVYEVRSAGGIQTIARVKVTELEDTRAKAAVLNAGPMAVGQEVVYLPKSAEEQAKHDGLRIVVCNFTPKAQDADVARAGQAFAFDFAKHLREAAASWQGLEVLQVPQMVSDHEPARALGRSYGADIVIWGTAMCFKEKGCVLPVYTVVAPERLAHAEREGREVRFDPLSPGQALEKGTARDPAGMVLGLLGELAFDAQRYGDTLFYLGRVPEGALEGDDHFRALRDLGESQWFLGRIEASLDTAGRLERAARGKDRVWEAVGVGQRARILTNKGQVDEALKLHREALAVYEALGDRRERAVTLGDIARILTDKGQVDEALKLHREALAVYEALGDRRERAVTLFDVARIHLARKDVSAGLPMLRESYEIALSLGDAYGTAFVGELLAETLLDAGAKKEAEPIVAHAAEALTTIGKTEDANALRARLARPLAKRP